MTYFAVHGPTVLVLLNRLEMVHQGSLLPWILVLFIEIHSILGPNMLENMCFGDMGINYNIGSIGCFKDNFRSYAAYVI